MLLCSRISSARICARSAASRLDSGSSIRNTCGRRSKARPSATRCRSPPDSWAGRLSSNPPMPSMPATSSTCWRICALGTRRTFIPNARFPRYRLMRKKRIALKHHRHIARFRRQRIHRAPADLNPAIGRPLQTGHHTQACRLSAAGGAEQNQELTIRNVERQVFDHRKQAEEFIHLLEADFSHRRPPVQERAALIRARRRRKQTRPGSSARSASYRMTTGRENSSENADNWPNWIIPCAPRNW